jgi:hypothetical protein
VEEEERMDFVSSEPKRSDDIPNIYLTNVRQLKFVGEGEDDLNSGVKKKIENLNIYIDSILPYHSALLLGH